MPFKSVVVSWCSCGSVNFDVVYVDDTTDHMHYGTLPNYLGEVRMSQLRDARERFLDEQGV